MSGLTPETYKEVRNVLLECAPLGSDAEVRAVFANPHLKIWSNQVRSSYSPAGRADLLIDFLHSRANTKGQNALSLFLFVLGDSLPEGDGCRRRLLGAATAVARETGASLPEEMAEEEAPPRRDLQAEGGSPENQPQIVNYYFYDKVIGDILHGGDKIHEQRKGDTINMPGDFRGAIVNLKSHIDNSRQLIEQLPEGDPEARNALAQSISDLERRLAELPAARAADAETIARRVKDLLEEASSSRPDPDELERRGDSLKRAAENVKEALPTVLAIATAIVQHVTALV